jgi:hypothetical protein
MTGSPKIVLPVPIETEHIETWRGLYLTHFPTPDDPIRCNEPSCGETAPCWYSTHARRSLDRVGEPLPVPTDTGHPDYPKEQHGPDQ